MLNFNKKPEKRIFSVAAFVPPYAVDGSEAVRNDENKGMLKKRRQISLDRLHLTNSQREGVLQMLASLKNKYRKLLHEAHERMHILTDLSSGMEYWMNVDGHIEYVNPACETVTGYTAAEFQNRAVELGEIIHPDCRDALEADRKAALEGELRRNAQYKLLHKDGRTRRMLASWSPVQTRRGMCIGARVTITDVTDVKQDAGIVKSYDDVLAELVSAAGDVLLLWLDADGRITEFTAPEKAALASAYIGAEAAAMIRDKRRIAKAIASLLKGDVGMVRISDASIGDGDGGRLDCSLVISSHADAGDARRAFSCLIKIKGDATI